MCLSNPPIHHQSKSAKEIKMSLPNKPKKLSPERAEIRKRVAEMPINQTHVKFMHRAIKDLAQENARLRYLLSL